MASQTNAGFGFPMDSNNINYNTAEFAKPTQGNTETDFPFGDEGTFDTSTYGSFSQLLNSMNTQLYTAPALGSSFPMLQDLAMGDTLGCDATWTSQAHPADTPALSIEPYQLLNNNMKRPLHLDTEALPQSKRHESVGYASHMASPFLASAPVTGSSRTMDMQPTSSPNSVDIGLSDDAADMCGTWFGKYRLLPRDRHIESLSQLTGEPPNAIRNWFSQMLNQGMTGHDSGYRSQTSLSQPTQSYNDFTTQSPSAQSYNDFTTQSPSATNLLACNHRTTTSPPLRGGKKGCTPTNNPVLLRRDPDKIFQCTRKCGKRYGRKCDWKRNEEEGYPSKSWICSLCVSQGTEKVKPCFRKYHFSQHFRNIHAGVNSAEYEESSLIHSETTFPRRCGFCSHRFDSRRDRIDHIANHFQKGKCMLDWNEDADGNNNSDDVDDDDDNDNAPDGFQGSNGSPSQQPDKQNQQDPSQYGSGSNNNSGGSGPPGGFGNFQSSMYQYSAPGGVSSKAQDIRQGFEKLQSEECFHLASASDDRGSCRQQSFSEDESPVNEPFSSSSGTGEGGRKHIQAPGDDETATMDANPLAGDAVTELLAEWESALARDAVTEPLTHGGSALAGDSPSSKVSSDLHCITLELIRESILRRRKIIRQAFYSLCDKASVILSQASPSLDSEVLDNPTILSPTTSTQRIFSPDDGAWSKFLIDLGDTKLLPREPVSRMNSMELGCLIELLGCSIEHLGCLIELLGCFIELLEGIVASYRNQKSISSTSTSILKYRTLRQGTKEESDVSAQSCRVDMSTDIVTLGSLFDSILPPGKGRTLMELVADSSAPITSRRTQSSPELIRNLLARIEQAILHGNGPSSVFTLSSAQDNGRDTVTFNGMASASIDKPPTLASDASESTWQPSDDADSKQGSGAPILQESSFISSTFSDEVVLETEDSYLKSQSFSSVKLLGAGGFSTVDEVIHRETNLRISRKTLKNRDPSAIEELKREVGLLQKLRHPHIIRFLGAYSKEDKVSILLAPVADTTLAVWLENCRQVANPNGFADEAAGLADKVFGMLGCLTSSIRYLHEQRPVVKHMDIKPQNILIMQGNHGIPHVVLCDFGISSSDESSSGLDPQPLTRQYCAPEVPSGIARDQAADIWSLGCVFLEMLSVVCNSDPQWLDFRKEFSGRDGQYYWQGVSRLQDWVSKFADQTTGVEEATALRTVRSMLKEHPAERPTASMLTMVFLPAPCCLTWPNESASFPGPLEELAAVEMILGNEDHDCLAKMQVSNSANHKSQHGSLSHARAWLDDCLRDHKACHQITDNVLPTRLVDIRPNSDAGSWVRLVNTADIVSDPTALEYAALSYIWGDSHLTLSTASLQSMQSRLHLESLPKSIRDAFAAADGMGIRYVFVDSLCILQDSDEDKRREILAMASFYRNATLTISVASNPPLMDHTPSTPDWQLSSSKWSTRCWTYQERLLSHRLLHLTGEQMYWECNALKASETFPRGLPSLVWEKVHTKSIGGRHRRAAIHDATCGRSKNEGDPSAWAPKSQKPVCHDNAVPSAQFADTIHHDGRSRISYPLDSKYSKLTLNPDFDSDFDFTFPSSSGRIPIFNNTNEKNKQKHVENLVENLVTKKGMVKADMTGSFGDVDVKKDVDMAIDMDMV